MPNVFSKMHRRVSSLTNPTKTSSDKSAATALSTDPTGSQDSSASIVPSRHTARDSRLLDLDKLLDGTTVPDKDRQWFTRVNQAVLDYTNDATHDASHDYEHIQRVVKEAFHLWHAEKHHSWAKTIDPLVIFTAGMVHDIADAKYLSTETEVPDDASIETDEAKQTRQYETVYEFLQNLGCPPAVTGPASHIASLVSFTREVNDPERVSAEAEAYPALKFVQDADRLDALGAMGVARLFVYGGVDAVRRGNTILTGVGLMEERFKKYPGMMKTRMGMKEAERRWEEMREFGEKMVLQAGCEDVLRSD